MASGEAAALLVVDMQVGMFNGQRIPSVHGGEALLARVRTLLAKARSCATPIIYVRHAGPSGHLLEAHTGNWQIHPLIAARAGEVIVDKRTPDAFHETTLMSELATACVKRLIVVGVQSEICVDTTCRRASTLGFDAALVSDGHSTWGNGTLTADQIIRHTNETLATWFVQTVSAAEVERSLGTT